MGEKHKHFKKQCERTVNSGKIFKKKTAGRGVSSIQGVLVFETNTTFESVVYNRPQGLFFNTGSSGHEKK